MVFASTAYAWPDDCDAGDSWSDPEDGSTCEATGTISVHAGMEFCNANCGSGLKQFSIQPH
jgi:hypothetical protein